MAIPTFEQLMLPVLQAVQDGEPHALQSLVARLADQFALTPDERKERIAAGPSRMGNRVHWAVTYMVHAGLLERPSRGKIRITELGRSVLTQKPEALDVAYLHRFPEFRDWRLKSGQHGRKTGNGIEEPASAGALASPEEVLEDALKRIRSDLKEQLLQELHECDPAFFEKLVVDLLTRMHYGSERENSAFVAGGPGDGGIDGEIRQDPLGLDVAYVQAKRWQGPVGRPAIQAFVGALHGKHASKGVFITTSSFTEEACRYAEQQSGSRVVLIDGQRLAELMIDYGVGVTTVRSIPLQRVDRDYFTQE